MSDVCRFHFEPEWSFFTSAYFLWITSTSIGLGDFGPGDEDMMVSAYQIARRSLMVKRDSFLPFLTCTIQC
jgi:hypothetical protein